ncbi:MAG TPA: DUF4150 domain-containing protein [Burkholderiaceae bacterium]|nr:DUF4150 domain-containing protein [Burkholderiaceae bacterium]
MPVTVKVNGVANSLVHKGSNGISIATIPDVCKTPSPGGPIPIPYPNISQSVTLDKGTTTVKADGGMMIATKGSEFSLSNGDNAGVAGGVKSSTFMKESTWILYSFDVKMDGSNACRLTDKKFQNHENTVDLAGTIQDPKTIPEFEKMLCEIWQKCEDRVNRKHGAKIKSSKWCEEDGNRFKTGGEKHACCSREIKKLQKKAKRDLLKNTRTDPHIAIPGVPGKHIVPDVVIGDPVKNVYDFKFQCPATSREPAWPIYSNKHDWCRDPPAPKYEGMNQQDLYEDVTGRKPKMINENSKACA